MDENKIYESEISPKEVITRMKLNIYNNYTNNSLLNINLDYILNRPSLFSLIHKISNYIGFKSQTYFLSVYYLDIIFSQNKNLPINIDFKVLSLACLLLAAKYVENDQNVPNLPSFVMVFNLILKGRPTLGYKVKGMISEKELFYAEVVTCKLLKYKLNYFTTYDFDSFFFGHGIIKLEQLKELNSGINGANSELNENSNYIRKILEKIYRKSRYYLDMIINNGNICLKYNSLIISVAIMKKSVEEILIKEQKGKEYNITKFKEKTAKRFKEIMLDLYQIDYESMNDYQNLINDSELNKIFQNKSNIINGNIYNDNFKTWKEKEKIGKINNCRYRSVLNESLNENNIFFKKLDNVNKLMINKSAIDSEEDKYYNSKIYKKERISVPKRFNITKKYTDIGNFNSTFSKDFRISKHINLVRNGDSIDKSNKQYSELDNFNNYMHTYTNDFYSRKKRESNNNKNNLNTINIEDSIEQTKNIIDNNTINNNNIHLNNDNIIKSEIASKINSQRNYEKYRKIVLHKKKFNTNILNNNFREYSVSQVDNSTNLEEIKTKPYFKKVIKNSNNYITKTSTNTSSFFNTINSNMYNKQNKNIKLNFIPLVEKEKDKDINNKEIAYTINNINQSDNNSKNSFNKKNFIFNQRKKIYSNNILNTKTIDNSIFTNTNKENNNNNDEISFSSNDYLSKQKERRKLLFERMKYINNKLSFKNRINNTNIKETENNTTNNNAKEKIYENQITNKTGNNKINGDNKIDYVIKDIKPQSIRYKYLIKKNYDNKNINNTNINNNKEIKKEKSEYPNSSIYNLINKTKTLNENKLDISKEEIDLDLVHKFKKYLYNKNKTNKILKNNQTLQLNNTTEINTPNNAFNTIDNNNDKNSDSNNNNENKNIMHGYHYRNYMKSKIKKEKETDNKIKNNINDNSKMIVINNNININFNNKIEHSRYQNNKKDNENLPKSNITDSKKAYNEMTFNKNNKYNLRGTIDYINNDITIKEKGNNNSLFSMSHRLTFYKKSKESNTKKIARESTNYIKNNN